MDLPKKYPRFSDRISLSFEYKHSSVRKRFDSGAYLEALCSELILNKKFNFLDFKFQSVGKLKMGVKSFEFLFSKVKGYLGLITNVEIEANRISKQILPKGDILEMT